MVVAKPPVKFDARVVMWAVIAALIPATIVQTWAYGGGVLSVVLISVTACVAIEAAFLLCVGRDARAAVADGSVWVAGLLIALAVPPETGTVVLVVAAAFAVLVAKHAFGGLGRNVFNPAMVGYAVILVSFPLELAIWPTSNFVDVNGGDALTGATALDLARQGLSPDARLEVAKAGVDKTARALAVAYLVGGLALVVMRFADWRLVAPFLVSVAVSAAIVSALKPDGYGVWLHLVHGTTVAGAFFIITDPVTAPAGTKARVVYAGIIGLLTVVIREYGGYPDGLAFAVLLGNACAPALERAFIVSARRS